MKKTIFIISSFFLIFFNFVCSAPKKVAILVYDEVYLLDFAGPLEVFNDCYINDSTKGFEVFLVAETKKEVKVHTGMLIKPDYSFNDCPQPDILVVPGGNLNLVKQNKSIAKFILNTDNGAEVTMSVCTGAFILAELGMLNDLEATTWFGAKQRLAEKYPKIKVVDKRITDNGKYITTAGVSAGVDGALHIVKRIYGESISDGTSRYIEWNK